MPEYKSPQSEPGMERHMLLLFLLMAVVIFGSQVVMRKDMPQQPSSTARPRQGKQGVRGSAPGGVPVSADPAAASAQKPAKPPQQPASSKQAATESETVVENDLYRITFTNRGAQAKSWV